MAKQKENRYRYLGNGQIVGDGQGMAKLFKPKVLICRQILGLSAQHIAAAFGCVGQVYIDAMRSEMLRELEACTVPLTGWREIADRVKGRAETIGLAD